MMCDLSVSSKNITLETLISINMQSAIIKDAPKLNYIKGGIYTACSHMIMKWEKWIYIYLTSLFDGDDWYIMAAERL